MNAPVSVEVEEIRSFLAAHEPFSRLPEPALNGLAAGTQIGYARKGEVLIRHGEVNDELGVIRSGAVDVIDEDGILLDRRDIGQTFGYSTLVAEPESHYQMEAVEDSLIIYISRETFAPLAEEFADFLRYFSSLSERIRLAAEQTRSNTSSEVLRTPLGAFAITDPAATSSRTTLRDAAISMGEQNVSSLLVIDDRELRGIITDRDMRRSVAADISGDSPVSEAMTANPISLGSDALVFEAMLLMAERGIHHIPVVDDGKVAGIIAAADIMRLMQSDPLYLSGQLARQSTPEELAETYRSAKSVAIRFLERGASSEEAQRLLTVATDALTRRLLTLAEEELGPAPVPFAFAVLGSQGRREMGTASDQDNALVISDEYQPEEHCEYFRRLGEMVCQGLATAGQPLCPGDMMASNPQWRMTVSQWRATFHHWITAPEPEALLHAQTFFDMRAVGGGEEMVDEIHAYATAAANQAPRLHAHLAALAVRREPPLGVFRGLILGRRGEHAHTLDIKKGGLAAVVQIARLHAILSGSHELSTRSRLAAAAGESLSRSAAADLTDAFDFLSSISLHHQVKQDAAGEVPDYRVDPGELKKMEREHLRDAFQIIKKAQSGLSVRFPVRSV